MLLTQMMKRILLTTIKAAIHWVTSLCHLSLTTALRGRCCPPTSPRRDPGRKVRDCPQELLALSWVRVPLLWLKEDLISGRDGIRKRGLKKEEGWRNMKMGQDRKIHWNIKGKAFAKVVFEGCQRKEYNVKNLKSPRRQTLIWVLKSGIQREIKITLRRTMGGWKILHFPYSHCGLWSGEGD